MVTVPMPAAEKVRLDELRSSVSHAAAFEQLLVEGVQQRIQQFNRAADVSDNDRAVMEIGENSAKDLAEQVALTEKQLKVAREAAKEAHKAYSQQQPEANRSSQQARVEFARAQELRASAEAQIIQEAYQHFVRALSASGKNDTEGASNADQSIAALIKEAEARTEQAKRDLERGTARVQAPGKVLRPASTAVKWVLADREGGPLRARSEAAQILMDVPDGQVLNVVTILGAARHGKSFLMNALTGCDNVFPVSPEVHPCTAGADLSPILMPLSDFAKGGGVSKSLRQSPSSQPTIALVDMEGQGDKSTEHGVRLATTFLVVSKVVIYNWLSLPNKTTMLQELVMMIKAAEKVVNQEGKRAHAFGHLIILMRDVTDKADEIKALIMDKEDTDDLPYDAAKDEVERNLIRRGLKKAFESITVHTMPSPHPDIGRGAVPLTTVTPEFNTSLAQLRRTIAGHLASPHKFADREIAGGERINDIVGSLCTAINKTGSICPPSVLESLDMARAEQEVQRALVNFDVMLGSTFGGHLALTTLETNTALKVAESSAKEQFAAATQAVSDVIKKEAAEKLEQQMSPKAEIVARNQEAKRHELKNRMRAIASQHEADLAEEARSLKVPMEEKALEDQWNILVNSHFVEMKRDIEAMVAIDDKVREDLLTELGWDLSREDFEDLLNDTHLSLQDLNRSAAAGKKDREARVKAEKKMGELAEQAEVFKEEVQVALKKAEQAQAAAEEAQAKAARDAQQQSQSQMSALMMMMTMMGGGGGGGFGGGGAGAYPGAGGGHPGMAGGGYSGMGGGGYAGGGGSTLRFYPGGQFIPGGARSPKGGGYF